MSYPDFIEDGETYITETQKKIARTHKIDPVFFQKITGQCKLDIEDSLICKYHKDAGDENPQKIKLPKFPDFSEFLGYENITLDLRRGFSFIMQLNWQGKATVLFDSRLASGEGMRIRVNEEAQIELIMNDGRTECCWQCDPEQLVEGKMQHVAIIVDGGPKIISYIIDGKFNDGGSHRQFGWGHYNSDLCHVNGRKTAEVNSCIGRLKIYNRALLTCEAVHDFEKGNGRA
jgi:hypothetical protein